jgi:hypothetical protein
VVGGSVSVATVRGVLIGVDVVARRVQKVRRLGACGLLLVAVSGCAAQTQTVAQPTVPAARPAVTAQPSATAKGSVDAPAAGKTGVIPFGPGPLPRYTVQAQPAAGTCRYRYVDGYPLPDPACTPGARNPKVTQATLASTICRSGYTASIRPPVSITSREKAANARSYGYTGSIKTAEYDHLISLALGGDPNDPRNLWVEPNDKRAATNTTNSKEAVENVAHAAVCNGTISLEEVQAGIATDWVAFGRRLGRALPAVR